MDSKQIKERHFLRRLLSVFIDFVLVFSITIWLDRIVKLVIWIPFPVSFILSWILYYSILLVKFRSTIGSALFGLWLEIPATPKVKGKIVQQCIAQSLLLLGIPTAATAILLRMDTLSLFHVLAIVGSYYCLLLVFYLCLNKSIGCFHQKAQYVNKCNSLKKQLFLSCVPIAAFLFCFGFMLYYNNFGNSSDSKLFGFKQPMRLKEYPSGPWLNKYTSFLNEQQNAKNYLLDLFDKYDIVILMENNHDGTPEWNFIYDVVSDSSFIHKVGHVFTEYGGQKFQNEVDTFLSTRYDCDTTIEKKVAEIWGIRPFGFAFSNFLFKLNKLNATLPDSMKIHEHFTGWDDGKYFTYRNYDTVRSSISYDSSMAKVVIDWYYKIKGKCLVITNTCHSWMLQDNNIESKLIDTQEASIINKKLPNKVANIYYYGQSPIAHGKWRTAFKETNCRSVGFDLKDSPFGKEEWIRYPLFFIHSNLKYQNIFTGMIFNSLEEDCFTYQWGNRFSQHGVLYEYSEALKRGEIDSSTLLTPQVYMSAPGNVKQNWTINDILNKFTPKEQSVRDIWGTWLYTTYAAIDFLVLLPLMMLSVVLILLRLLLLMIINRK